jgi:hypothetical protein
MATQIDFVHVTLVRPTGSIQADFLQDLGNHLLIGFDRPMVSADLQGPDSRFPWTKQSGATLNDLQGHKKIVHCSKIVRYCREHQICWLDSDYQACPQCIKFSGS